MKRQRKHKRTRVPKPTPRFSKGHDLSRRPHQSGAVHPCAACLAQANRTGGRV